MSKRVFDFVGACVLLLLFFPVMITIAVLIKVTTHGPVLFHQDRIGFQGRVIRICKFQTFFKNESGDTISSLITTKGDPRITPIGRFLRSTHFDELPQFWNVLRGDMSLVGPRPRLYHNVKELEQKAPGFESRHQVTPGITGLAQLKKRDLTDNGIRELARLDLTYVNQAWSPWLDLKILFLTIGAVIRRQGF